MLSKKTKFALIILIISASSVIGTLSGFLIYETIKSNAIIIRSEDDFAKYNIPGRGWFDNPYIITNRTITDEDIGILVYKLAGYLIIENCTISGCNIGIQIEDYHGYSRSVIIRNNKISNIKYRDFSAYGIRILESFGINIENNLIFGRYSPIKGIDGDFANGIVLENSYNIRVINNTISKCTNGMVLIYCSYSEVLDNNISYSYYSIVGDDYSSYVDIGRNNCYMFYFAIYMGDCFYWQIYRNYFNFTVQDHYFGYGVSSSSYGMFGCGGMRLDGLGHEISRNIFNDCYTASQDQSENSVYRLNNITNTNYYGFVAHGRHVLIYHNNFINNYGIPSQGLDLSTTGNNSWYSDVLNEGNYWSNWNGTGPYPIEGWANKEDKYPLIKPVNINI